MLLKPVTSKLSWFHGVNSSSDSEGEVGIVPLFFPLFLRLFSPWFFPFVFFFPCVFFPLVSFPLVFFPLVFFFLLCFSPPCVFSPLCFSPLVFSPLVLPRTTWSYARITRQLDIVQTHLKHFVRVHPPGPATDPRGALRKDVANALSSNLTGVSGMNSMMSGGIG